MSNTIRFTAPVQSMRFFTVLALGLLLISSIFAESAAAQRKLPPVITPAFCAPGEIQTTYNVGAADNFMLPKDAPLASPSPTLLGSLGGVPATQTDIPAANQALAHTFDLSNVAPDIVSATLRVHAKPNIYSADDKINLIFTASVGHDGWGTYFGAGNPRSILPDEWDIGYFPNGNLFTLDLALLQYPTVGPINLIPSLNSTGYLDMYVMNDTTVDYVTLTTCSQPSSIVLVN